jgi:hypothetical protein
VVLGGLLGAIAGGAVGHYAYDRTRTREETAQKYAYNESKGTVVRIEDASVAPATVKPGGTVDLKMTYALLNPSAGKEFGVTETREIKYNGQLVGNPQVKVSRVDGTYSSSESLMLPASAKKGVYSVISTVQAGNAQDSRETSFRVQ